MRIFTPLLAASLLSACSASGGASPGNVAGTGNATQTSRPALAPLAVTVADLEKAVDENEVGALNTYGRRTLLVSGRVRSVFSGSDGPTVGLESAFTMPVLANLEATETSRAGGLRRGDAIRLLCREMSVFMTKPTLDRCTIDAAGAA